MAAQRPVGAPAFSPASSTAPSSANPKSKIPNPKSLLPPDLESLLLLDAAAGILDAPQIAAKHDLSLGLYLDWYASPTTATRLTALIASRDHVRLTKYQVFQDEAAATLRELHTNAADNADPVERRRSATALLRFTTGIISGRASPARLFASMGLRGHSSASSARDANGLSLSRFPSHFRARSRKVREVPILHEPPAILPPPYFPHKDASPSEATIELLHRLQCNDNPRAGDGLRNLFNYFSPKWREAVEAKTADDFACTRFSAYHSLIAHHSAVLHPTQFPTPASSESNGNTTAEPPLRATQRFDLIDLDGDRFTGEFHFTRASPSAPWLIDSLDIEDTPDPEPVPEPGPPNSS